MYKYSSLFVVAVVTLLGCIVSTDAAVGNAAAGTVIWTGSFWKTNSLTADAWNTAGSFASITSTSLGYNGNSALKITSTSTDPSVNTMISKPLDLNSYGGCTISVTPRIKTTSVSTPAHSYLGVKTMLAYKSPTVATQYAQTPSVSGTIDWSLTADTFTTTLMKDINSASIYVGLQGVTGTAYWDKIVIKVVSCPGSATAAPTKAPTKAPTAKPGATIPPTPASTTKIIPSPGHTGIPRMRGTMVSYDINADFTYADLSGWGANVYRWQTTTTGEGSYTIPQGASNIPAYLNWCDERAIAGKATLNMAAKHQMKVVIDNHSPPGKNMQLSNANYYTILANSTQQDALVVCWQKWATAFKGYKALWGYDILNEPHWEGAVPTPDSKALSWPALATRIVNAIRAIDATVPIFIEPMHWASSTQPYVSQLPLFPNDKNIIYEVHFYGPSTYGVGTPAPITESYPGTIDGKLWNKAAIISTVQPIRDFSLAHNVPVYVGEFSAPRYAPGAAQFLADCISVWEMYGWDWTYHVFREALVWNLECPDSASAVYADCTPSVVNDRKPIVLNAFKANVKPAPIVQFSLNESIVEYYNETSDSDFWEDMSAESGDTQESASLSDEEYTIPTNMSYVPPTDDSDANNATNTSHSDTNNATNTSHSDTNNASSEAPVTANATSAPTAAATVMPTPGSAISEQIASGTITTVGRVLVAACVAAYYFI